MIATIEPGLLAAIITGVLGLLGGGYAVYNQRKTDKEKVDAQEKETEEKHSAAQIAAQVELTKDVLKNWKGIVENLGLQIGQLNIKVTTLEDREQRCQKELLQVRGELQDIRNRLDKTPGGTGA